MHNGERGMKVYVHLWLLEQRERPQIVADQFRQLRIDQRDDLARVQRATNGTTEGVEHVQLPSPFLEVVALGLQQALLLAELLIRFLQLLIRFLQIAREMIDFEKCFAVFQPGRHALFNLGQLQRFDEKIEGALLEGSPYQGRTGIVRHEEDTRITLDRKSTRLNSSHLGISYAVFCLKKK